MTYRIEFGGREKFAIGHHMKCVEIVEAETPEAARLLLYDKYDSINSFHCEPLAEHEARKARLEAVFQTFPTGG